MNPYTAIIPVAGKGIRLLPYTQFCAKTMLPVAGRPVIAHILEQVEACGIKKIVFIVGYQKESFIAFIQQNYPHLQAEFLEQTQLKGLGHAVYLAKEAVKGPCLIVLGDTIIDGDLAHLLQRGKNTVGVKQVADPHRFGIVEMSEGKIVGFEEKPQNPKSDTALIGAYAFDDSALLFSALEKVIQSGKTVKNEIQLTDALSVLLEENAEILPIPMQNWFDCGTVEVMLRTNQALIEKNPQIPSKFLTENHILAPCWIDEEAQLEHCVLGPYVSVGKGAVLKECKLQDVIVFPDTKLQGQTAHHTFFMKEED